MNKIHCLRSVCLSKISERLKGFLLHRTEVTVQSLLKGDTDVLRKLTAGKDTDLAPSLMWWSRT